MLAFLVDEMQRFVNQYTAQILPPIWQLLTQTADIYVKVAVNCTVANPFENAEEGKPTDLILRLNGSLHSSKTLFSQQQTK